MRGHEVNLGCYVVALFAGTALWWSYKIDNAKRDRAANETVKRNKHDDLLGEDLGDLGDRCVNDIVHSCDVTAMLTRRSHRHPSFRYYL